MYMQMILLKYSEYYDLFPKEDRNEFLFRIFRHVLLGGEFNQVSQFILIPCR